MNTHGLHTETADYVEQPPTADRELVRRFVVNRDERAFAELVVRYSDLVLGVCRRTLGDVHDAEEAFQATFMVLASKAARVRIERTLGPWLYGVAYRTSVRAAAKRQRRRETRLPDDVAMIDDALQNVAECHWRRVLDDELNLLPEKYRSALVLHYLLGRTNKEVAAELDLSVRTVEGRQRRGKALLKRRLMLRKVSFPAALGLLASPHASAAPLVEEAIRASLCYVNGNSQACSANAVRLAQSEALVMTSSVAPVSAMLVTLVALGAAATVIGGDAPAKEGGALPLAAAIEAAVDAGDVAVNATEARARERRPAEAGLAGVDLFQRSAAERHILSALESPLSSPLDFAATPLNQVTRVIREDYGIQIVFDTAALDAVAVSPEVEVTVGFADIPLQSVLRLTLMQIPSLTYIVRDDVLMITTKEEANARLETHIYDLSQLDKQVEVAELVAVIPEVVFYDTWQVSGTGEGTIKPLGQRMFVVSQTHEVHEAISQLLAQMQNAQPKNGE